MWTYTGSGTIRQKAVTGYALSVASLTASITVNALATGLIVFRIFKVFREVKNAPIFEPDEKSLGIFGGKQLSNILFVILESGMTLFAVQLARLVIITTKLSTHAEENAFTFIVSIHEMFNVIIF
jgi:hypothetical protein